MAAGAWQSVDLLRRRRQEQGVASIAPAPVKGLLLRGSLIGIALVAAGGLGWIGIAFWVRLLEARVQDLQPVAAEHQTLETQLTQLNQELEQVKTANRSLADAILSIPSGALLLADLAVRTPRSIQLNLIRQEGQQLIVNGVAAQPDALRAINAFQLELERSPLFDPAQVQLVKIQQQQAEASGQGAQQLPAGSAAGSQAALPLGFELKALMTSTATKAKLPRLQAFGALGLLKRLEVLRREGLLQ